MTQPVKDPRIYPRILQRLGFYILRRNCKSFGNFEKDPNNFLNRVYSIFTLKQSVLQMNTVKSCGFFKRPRLKP